MKTQKGFFLSEVLLSLMLVATVVLALINQQQYIRQFVSQLVWRADATQLLDSVLEQSLQQSNLPQIQKKSLSASGYPTGPTSCDTRCLATEQGRGVASN